MKLWLRATIENMVLGSTGASKGSQPKCGVREEMEPTMVERATSRSIKRLAAYES